MSKACLCCLLIGGILTLFGSSLSGERYIELFLNSVADGDGR